MEITMVLKEQEKATLTQALSTYGLCDWCTGDLDDDTRELIPEIKCKLQQSNVLTIDDKETDVIIDALELQAATLVDDRSSLHDDVMIQSCNISIERNKNMRDRIKKLWECKLRRLENE